MKALSSQAYARRTILVDAHPVPGSRKGESPRDSPFTCNLDHKLPRWMPAVEALMVAFAVHAVPVIAMEIMEVMPVVVEVLARMRKRPMVPISRIIVVVHRPEKSRMPVKPRSGPDENAVAEPLRPIVTIRRAVIRRIAVVPVRASR